MTIFGGCSHTGCPPGGPCRMVIPVMTQTAPWPTLPPAPLRTFGPCPKCGEGSDILVEHHDGKNPYKSIGIPSCKYAKNSCGKYGTKEEHLRVHCRRCQWGWREKVGVKA